MADVRGHRVGDGGVHGDDQLDGDAAPGQFVGREQHRRIELPPQSGHKGHHVTLVGGAFGRKSKPDFAAEAKHFRRGFKLFYHEDLKMMSPAQVMRLTPRPDIIVYE